MKAIKNLTITLLLMTVMMIAAPMHSMAATYTDFGIDAFLASLGIADIGLIDKGSNVYLESGASDEQTANVISGVNRIPAKALEKANQTGMHVFILSANTFDRMYKNIYGHTDRYVNGVACTASLDGMHQICVVLKLGRPVDYSLLVVHEIGHVIDGIDFQYSNTVFPVFECYINNTTNFDPVTNDRSHIRYSNEFFAESFNWWVHDSEGMRRDAYPLYTYFNNIFDIPSAPEIQVVAPEQNVTVASVPEQYHMEHEHSHEIVSEEQNVSEEEVVSEIVSEEIEEAVSEEELQDVSEVAEEIIPMSDDEVELKLQSILGENFDIRAWDDEQREAYEAEMYQAEIVASGLNHLVPNKESIFERIFAWLYYMMFGEELVRI